MSTTLSNCKLGKSTRKGQGKKAHLGISSSVPPGGELALGFQVAALGPLGLFGKRSPLGELAPSWDVFRDLPLITLARVRSSSVSSPSSSSLDAVMGRRWLKGIKWLGRSMSGIGGMLLYTFTSSYKSF
jgi:hypothetical protein